MLVLSVKTLFITMGIWFGNPWFLGFVLFVTLLLYITLNDIIHSFIQILTILYTSSYVTCLQLNPEILCLDIGLCSSNGFHRMKYKFSNFPNLDSFETHSYVSVLLTKVFFFFTCSDIIETVVHNESWDGSPIRESPFCTFCNMIVLWIQVQLKQSNLKEKVLKYVDEVVSNDLQ